MKKFRYLKNVATLKYDEELCIGCGRCLEVCPHAVFKLLNGRAKIIDFDACMECGACAKNCPVTALAVTAGVGCAAGLLTEWLRERGVKLKQDGC
ncbi:mercury methylation ferredoxin HgcB [Malonomonas rubra]|uniref:mercury methylation ferredoxin HgcB n=1 Tax=Malonomonas rubra TaxID=57040 RepID=UPI0026EBE86B|nr:mercury methylation ferredoxin HgcB [Malonomonas rubra]